MKSPKVAIVITTYNQDFLSERCICSLREKTNYKNYKVYLVDDSGKGEIGEKIKKKFSWVDVTINKKNLGFSKSNNIGIKKALKKYNPDYVLLLNDDTEVVQKDWLKKMVEVGESDEKIGILGCKIIYPDGSLQWFFKNSKINFMKKNKFIKDTKETSTIKEIKDVIGACFMISKKVINKVGLLDEKFSPFYGEDTDFCCRTSKKGFKLIYVGNTKIIHYGSSSTKTICNERIWFIKKRNAIRLEWLNFSFRKIISYSFIHLGSAILNKNPLKKLRLLLKAYLINLNDLKEIKRKRNERNKY